MRQFIIFLALIAMLSCSSKSQVTTSTPEPKKVTESSSLTGQPIISFISGTRQKVFPGIDDGSGRYSENWILKLDVPRDYLPEIKLELMGYVIPIDRKITVISEEEKAVLRFSVAYPLMDNYDRSDNQPNAKPILFLRTAKGLVTLDISGCQNITPVAYPSIQKEGGY